MPWHDAWPKSAHGCAWSMPSSDAYPRCKNLHEEIRRRKKKKEGGEIPSLIISSSKASVAGATVCEKAIRPVSSSGMHGLRTCSTTTTASASHHNGKTAAPCGAGKTLVPKNWNSWRRSLYTAPRRQPDHNKSHAIEVTAHQMPFRSQVAPQVPTFLLASPFPWACG